MQLFLRTRTFIMSLIATVSFTPSLGYAQSDIWVSAYYAGWMQGYANNGRLPAQKIDYSTFTHIIHFSLVPRTDGTLDSDANSITLINSQELVTRARAAGTKVIISVGGWASDVGFRGATSSANLSRFINNLISFMQSRGYDGIDIDWERLESSDASQYVTFITQLRNALDTITPRPLLTAAVAWQPSILAQVHDKFDQINIMSYDYSGAWPGWVTWHNAPIYDGGYTFPSTGKPVPSIDGHVGSFVSSGIPASKLGIGIDFYGYVWNGGDGTSNGGVTDPRQSWSTAPTVQGNVPYYTIMDTYYQTQYYKWDNSAQVSYLSINNPGSANDKFISYDDELTAKKKVEYARAKKIGGVIIWELGGGFRANMPAGQQDPLLQAIKEALRGVAISPDVTPPTVSMNSPVSGSTISGTISLAANASDNVGVVGVQFKVNGVNAGNEITAYPFSTTFNTTSLPNGTATITAIARDAAGNQASASVSVTISNTSLPPTPPSSSDLVAFDESLHSPWLNASWSTTVTFGSTDQAFTENHSIKASLTSAWGGFSLHYGTWGSNQNIDPLLYKSLDVAIYATSTGTALSIFLENDLGQSFPKINTGTLTANQWRTFSIPMGQLNPNNQVIHRISIQDISGSTKTFYIDDLRLSGTSLAVPTPPVLSAPTNGATGVTTNVALSWNPSSGASSYRVQVSTSSSFASLITDQQNLPGTSFSPTGLASSTQYYWRVNARNTIGTSAWSDTFTFTTSSPRDTVPPTITITAPQSGATISGVVTLSATASDNIKVTGVQFSVNGSNLGSEIPTGPFSATLNTTSLANGS
ncbi:MAG TPA: glycosyl hydrolase family 18 protein, partial [Bacteroidota bacterium]|nr:glycosyl hydrolase family 18 protein [Bacteroidota bacterium]